MDGFRIKVDADLSQAEKAFDKAASVAAKDGAAVGKAFETGLNKIPPAINKANASLNNLSKQSNKTKFSMVDLSRVVQDLPYGFNGIANNLTQLIPGVGLLGLAFSGLVSALTFATVGTSAWTRGTHGANKAAKDHSEAVEEAKKKQEEFTQSIQSAAQQVVSEAKDFKDLRDEIASTTQEYLRLTDAIVKRGVAQALFDQKNTATQKLLAQQIEKTIDITKGTVAFLPEFKADEKTLPAIPLKTAEGFEVLGVVVDKFDTNINKSVKDSKALQSEISDINKLANILGISFEDIFKEMDKKVKEKPFTPVFNLKPLEDLLIKSSKFEIKELNIRGIKFPPVPEPEIDKLRQQLERSISSKPAEVTFKVKQDQAQLEKIKKDFDALTQGINRSINSIATDSLVNVGNAIGDALTGGGAGNPFADFANIIGAGLQEIGKQLIAFGVAAQLTQIALSQAFLNPGLAIAAGIALTAVGAALKNKLAQGVKGFAQGGLVFGPTLGLVGEGFNTRPSNPEVIAPLDKLRSMIGESSDQPQILYSRIRGNDILLSNNRTNRRNRRTGA